MKIDLICPVESVECLVKTSAATQDTYVMFKLFNSGDKLIKTVDLEVLCYDSYGAELARIPATLENINAMPGEYFATNKAVSVKDYPETKRAVLVFKKIILEDGSEYIPEEGVEVHRKDASAEEQLKLQRAAGEDAVCFSSDSSGHWVCICGRANLPEAEACARCHRNKTDVLNKFSTFEALTNELVNVYAAEEREQELQKQAELQARAEKRVKQQRMLKRGAVIAGAIVVAILVIVFLVKGIMILVAGSKASSGDFSGAYQLYTMAGSKKAAEVQDKASGNTMENIQQAGFASEDADYIYTLDEQQKIVRLKKDGTAAESLGSMGICINVVGDKVYYINTDNSGSSEDVEKIFRMNKDGSEKEAISDVTANQMIIIGDQIYYVAADKAGSYTLNTMNINGSGQKQISKTAMGGLFNIHNGYIYYQSAEDYSLHRMSMNGKGDKTIVKNPVGAFTIKDNSIYYIDITSMTQNKNSQATPVLPFVKTDLNGNHAETISEDCQIYPYVLMSTDEGLYYLNYSNQLTRSDFNLENQTVLNENQIVLFNITSGNIHIYGPSLGFVQLDRQQ